MFTKDTTPHPSVVSISAELQSSINVIFQAVISPPPINSELSMVNETVNPTQNTIIYPENPWNTLFTGNRLTAKGTSLKFVAPAVTNGISVACLDNFETDKLF